MYSINVKDEVHTKRAQCVLTNDILIIVILMFHKMFKEF